jgi:diguanylate cyclase
LFEDLFVHLCIVITFIFVGGMFFRNTPYSLKLRMKLVLGAVTGVLGSFLLHFSIQINEDTIMDMRHMAIIISAIYGGFISAFVSASIISVARWLLFGISTASIIAATGTMLVGIVLGVVNRLTIDTIYKWLLMILVSTGIYSIVLYYLINDPDIYSKMLGYYWLLSIVSGYVAYYFSNFISRSNQRNFDYQQQATVDYLTGLLNTRKFKTKIVDLLAKANMSKQNLSLISFDIDHFKSVNDQYGHPAGDKVLKDIGTILERITRTDDLSFRVGGEEFSIIMRNTNASEASQSAERLRNIIQEHPFILTDDTVIYCTISVGIATNTNFDLSPEKLIKHADEALYRAKHGGRNRVVVWEWV